jgi:hypothetical protein
MSQFHIKVTMHGEGGPTMHELGDCSACSRTKIAMLYNKVYMEMNV